MWHAWRIHALRWVMAVILAAASLARVPAEARELTASERAALAERVKAHEAAMHEGEADRIVEAMPPRLLAEIAAENGVAPDALRSAITAQFRKLKADGLTETITLDLTLARFASLGDGTPYVLIPTHVVVKGARRIDSRFSTLGLLDGGHWYLVDVSTPEGIAVFMKAFPEFAGVDFGRKTLKTKP